jgi:hypothetical protein
LSIDTYESMLVPALLQTPDYIRQIMRTAATPFTDDEVDQRVVARLRRQQRITNGNQPKLHAIVDAGHQMRGTFDCRHTRLRGGEQLDHVGEVLLALGVVRADARDGVGERVAGELEPAMRALARYKIQDAANRPTDTQLSAGAVAPTGGNQPHENMMPGLVVNYIISLNGIFPTPD